MREAEVSGAVEVVVVVDGGSAVSIDGSFVEGLAAADAG
jgi:hypothetical protein